MSCGGPLPAGTSIRRKYCRSACEDRAYYDRHPDKKRRLISAAQLEQEVQKRSAPRLAEQADLSVRLQADNSELQRRLATAQAQMAELERRQAEQPEAREDAAAQLDAEKTELRRRWNAAEAQVAAMKEVQAQNEQLQERLRAATRELVAIRAERDAVVSRQQQAEQAATNAQRAAKDSEEQSARIAQDADQARQALAEARAQITMLEADLRAARPRPPEETTRRTAADAGPTASPHRRDSATQRELDQPRAVAPHHKLEPRADTPPASDLDDPQRNQPQQSMAGTRRPPPASTALLPPSRTGASPSPPARA